MNVIQSPQRQEDSSERLLPPDPVAARLLAVRGRLLGSDDLARETVSLAEDLLRKARASQTTEERDQARKLARLMNDPHGKALTIALSDQVFRSREPWRIANQLRHLLHSYGSPRYLGWRERILLGTGGLVGQFAPEFVVPRFTARLRQETEAVILPAEEEPLRDYLARRYRQGMRLNLNQLGEAILGEDEARRRLEMYLALLARDDVEYISVKLSSICSQINLIAFDDTVALASERLRQLYRAALANPYRQHDGSQQPKFVNLDMEEYRDLHLTAQTFRAVLDEPEFLNLRAGLVLQAYLPDSYAMQQELTAWAIARCRQGGAPIKLRIVKGANLAMEQIEAAQHHWPQAPYTSKADTDANFKRMVAYGCLPERAAAVNLGIGSHNLFDIAYSLLLRAIHQIEDYVEFEMLEGMANHQARAVQAAAGGMLLYAPVVKQEEFHSAIAYLVRRLDENTDKENFLHDLFDLEPGSAAWESQRSRFLTAYQQMEHISDQPRRSQDRRSEDVQARPEAAFNNTPDTDWSLPANQAWIRDVLSRWQQMQPESVPLQVDGEFISRPLKGEGQDPSRPGVVAYRYVLASQKWVERALDVAVQARPDWAATPVSTRRALLVEAAAELARQRATLIGCMVLDGGKAVAEADSEVSEAIDFANYYARSLDLGSDVADCRMEALGVVVVTPPWNFPLAIPASGVLAALMAGNTVILKPAPEAVLVGWYLAQALWKAGIPRNVLQFLPCPDNEIGRGLVTDARVAAVILTGARSTALRFQEWKPELRLFAETSGKNSLIITALADRDQAIKDLVRSAFGHSGQKCSAASLAICEAEVYDDPLFRQQLRDAVASLPVGSAWNPASRITPLIRPPGPELARALTTLEAGEEWLLEPQIVGDNPALWSPGIKAGVRRGSFFHQNECFGPVLGLMRADNLAHAIELSNDTLYGLTSGIHSLDDREQEYWKEHIQVGNAYVNRHITGAIVRRQPFGGWKASNMGPGAKTGGPNYVLQFACWHQESLPQQQAEPAAEVGELCQRCLELMPEPEQRELLLASARSYAYAWQNHFGQQHDPSNLPGEANIFRYRPCRGVLLRVREDMALTIVCRVALAARTCGARLTISLPLSAPLAWASLAQEGAVNVIVEDEYQLISRLRIARPYERLRAPGALSPALRNAALATDLTLLDDPVLANGRLELRNYLHEQAISQTTHRYGNVMQPPTRSRNGRAM